MNLQNNVINLATKCRLASQHLFSNNLKVTEYPINLTALTTSAKPCKGGLQFTKVNQNSLDFPKMGSRGGTEWSGNIMILTIQGRQFKKLLCTLSYYPVTFQALSLFFPHLSSMLHPFLYTTLLQGEGKNQCVTTEVFNKRTLKGQWKTGILSLIKFVSYIGCELTHDICSMLIDTSGVFIPPDEGCLAFDRTTFVLQFYKKFKIQLLDHIR